MVRMNSEAALIFMLLSGEDSAYLFAVSAKQRRIAFNGEAVIGSVRNQSDKIFQIGKRSTHQINGPAGSARRKASGTQYAIGNAVFILIYDGPYRLYG